MSKKINKTPRRLLTASMSLALLISLSSCSGAVNTNGNLESKLNTPYASAGDKSVTYGELWNELQWSSHTVLNEQITNLILDAQIKNIKTVTSKEFSKLTDGEKESLALPKEGAEKAYESIQSYVKERLADYVVQDIYDQSFSKASYWDAIKDIKKTKNEIAIQKYIDQMYLLNHNYFKGDEAAFKKYLTDAYNLILEADFDAKDAKYDDLINKYLELANEYKDVYYPLLAKEMLAFQNLNEDIVEAEEKDKKDDPENENDKEGYFTNSQYKTMFENNHINTYDLSLVMIKFSSEEEYADTLRAFGLKVYNNKFYLVKDTKDYDPEENPTGKLSYKEYIDKYDDIKSYTLDEGVQPVNDFAMLEIYVQIYNYMYGGYRDKLPTAYTPSSDLNALRDTIFKINKDYIRSDNAEGLRDTLISSLKSDANKDAVSFTSEELSDMSSSLKTYVYKTLSNNNEINTQKRPFSTSTQSANGGYYIAYKFDNSFDELTDQEKLYENYFQKDDSATKIQLLDDPKLTSFEMISYIKEDKELFNDLKNMLTRDQLTETMITSAVDEAKKDVSVKIYNEALEISYLKDNPTYSKVHSKAANKNIIATIKYDGIERNINITKVDSIDDDKKTATTINGDPIGCFEILEKKSGSTVAIDLLTDKIVKDSQAYEDALKDKKSIETYEQYIETLLVGFSNGALAQQGFNAEMGKYNFLMLYFHTAVIDDIITDYYLVQNAASKLLTNYSNKSLSEDFFMKYTTKAYNEYFSLSGTRLVVYVDVDDDNEPDILTDDEWNNNYASLAKELIYTIYQKLASSSVAHTDRLNQLVEEINSSARVEYNENAIAPENLWAEFRAKGLKVKTEEFATTNSDVETDFALKNRLADYARGHNEDNTKKYEYFKNGQAPTIYMEPLTEESKSLDNNDIVKTEDGYNLILVTTGSAKPSAKWEKAEKDPEGLLSDIRIRYNDEYVHVGNIENEGDMLNAGQILLYVLDNAVNGGSTLSPASTQSALTTFLQPVLQRYSSAETQRIILQHFIKNETGAAISYTDPANTEYLAKSTVINQNIVDNYQKLYNENNPNIYEGWWEQLENDCHKWIGSNKEA